MKRILHSLIGFVALLTFGVCWGNLSSPIWAQEEETVPEASAKETDPKPDKTVEKAKPDKTKAEKSGEVRTIPSDPAVAALLATNPQTPSECVKTAKILGNLQQPELAKSFLQKVLDANLDRPQLAQLGKEIGSAAFLKFIRDESLQPQGKQLGSTVLEAVREELQNPEKIAATIQRLQDPSPDVRTQALVELQDAQNLGMAALIEVLADPKRESEFPNIRAALATMGRQASAALVGVLEKADPKLQVQILLVLGNMKANEAKSFLLFPSFAVPSAKENDNTVQMTARQALQKIVGVVATKDEAVQKLLEVAKQYYLRGAIPPGVVEGTLDVWEWDPKNGKCVITTIPEEDAARFFAARFAREAHLLAPQNFDALLLSFVTRLDTEAYRKGLDKPLDDSDAAYRDVKQTIQLLGTATGDTLLDYAIRLQRYPAATATASILGEIGKAEELLYPSSGQSTLVRAVLQPDRRLRFAAVKAIAKLQPTRPYPGSSKILQTLSFFASGTGTRRALAAGPNLNHIPQVVSGLSSAGYRVETANTGKEVLQQLFDSADFELVMIDAGINMPTIDFLIQQIRRDDRSADVRIGIVARAGSFEKAEHVAGSDPLTRDFPRPNEDSVTRWEVERLQALKPRDFVRPEERLRQATEALHLIAELAQTSPKLYDLRSLQDMVISKLKIPAHAAQAIKLLALINSPEAQQTLVQVANSDAWSLELRQGAAAAFGKNVESFGILLTTDEIRRQYAIYNQSEKAERAVQQLLGSILDRLESPREKNSSQPTSK